MKSIRGIVALAVSSGIAVWAASPAGAHPHVFVDATAEMRFDAEQRVVEIQNAWKFDSAFSAYATQGLDVDGDGTLSEAELKSLAQENVESLRDFEFFSYLTIGTDRVALLPPKKYWLEYQDQRLTLFFALPLEKPSAIVAPAMLEIFDREYFVEFGFPEQKGLVLAGAPSCAVRHHPPEAVDPQTMAVLGSLPQERRELPNDLVQAVSALANYFAITCR
jgi:ABC-type uncharacterized transport system substrate-binding protein